MRTLWAAGRQGHLARYSQVGAGGSRVSCLGFFLGGGVGFGGTRVWGLGFGDWWFGVWGLGAPEFGVWGSGFSF